MEDREWMYTGHYSPNCYGKDWIMKTDAFLELVFGEAARGSSKIWCPCSKCVNRKKTNKGGHRAMDLYQTIPDGSTMVKLIM